jgi:hypothetical protein
MAHPEQRKFFESINIKFPELFRNSKVLEVGSLDINGTVRDFFTDCDYTGVDLSEGPGVDVVGQGQELTYPDNFFDFSVSAECFEHNPFWAETFINMHRMSKSFVAFTCATEGRAEHGTTRTSPSDSPFTLEWDYYKNLTEDDFLDNVSIDLGMMFQNYKFTTNPYSHDLYFWGVVR